MEIDSMPVELDEIERRIMQLEIEREALRKEKDKASIDRLAKLEKELADLKEERARLASHWEQEKEAIQEGRKLKEELEAVRLEVERAQRGGDYTKASELQYGRVPDLERRIKEAEDRLANTQQGGHRMLKEEVDEEDIADVVSKWTHIPVSRLMEGEVQKLLHMEERLHNRVIGQDESIIAVSNAIRRARAGLQDPNRPLGSFLFLGPTGVGKTELGRALAEFLFDDEQAMIRIDMSEYQEKHTVSRMIGAPPGYVGYDEAGQLTEAVRRRPYAVVLFDEVEKAHPEVLNVLLQLLDDGRLTDGKGRTIDFKNTVVIMTSNLGSQFIAETAGRGAEGAPLTEGTKRQVMEELREHFRPEFLNRIDEIIFFHSLGRDHMKRIIDIQLAGLIKRLSERKIHVQLTDAAKDHIQCTGRGRSSARFSAVSSIRWHSSSWRAASSREIRSWLTWTAAICDSRRVRQSSHNGIFQHTAPQPAFRRSPRPASVDHPTLIDHVLRSGACARDPAGAGLLVRADSAPDSVQRVQVSGEKRRGGEDRCR